MKYLITILFFGLCLYGCDSSKQSINNSSNGNVANDTIRIANDSLEYEVIIFEVGFGSFLATQQPRGFYGLTFLENKNRLFVTNYNLRANNPLQYGASLYPQSINYEYNVDYGYEVNYLLYNYFLFFQKKYNQKL